MKEAAPPFPPLLTAIWLTVGSWLVTLLVLAAFVEPLGPIAALGLGTVAGFGVMGSLAARRVPPPQAERIGLRGFSPRLLLPLLLLVPLVLLASEIDNVVRVLLPAADPGAAPGGENLDAGLFALEAGLVMVGIAPVVEEFFFRGVVQQGLIAAGGPGRGIFLAALLYALGHGNLVGTPAEWLSATLGALLTGVVLGYLRFAARSLLAPILLSMTMSGAGLAAARLRELLPIPGFNAGGDHTPIPWLLGAAGCVALGLALLSRERGHVPPERAQSAELSPPRD
jgi:membrane protease YdiL (CAAX protease family)